MHRATSRPVISFIITGAAQEERDRCGSASRIPRKRESSSLDFSPGAVLPAFAQTPVPSQPPRGDPWHPRTSPYNRSTPPSDGSEGSYQARGFPLPSREHSPLDYQSTDLWRQTPRKYCGFNAFSTATCPETCPASALRTRDPLGQRVRCGPTSFPSTLRESSS